MVIGFIIVSVGALLLNRQSVEQMERMRPRPRRTVH
jgi:hypothetical protein